MDPVQPPIISPTPSEQQNPQPAMQEVIHSESGSSISVGKLLLILLGVVVVAGLMGGSYYLGVNQGKSAQLPVTAVSPSPMVTAMPGSATPSATANWQTYTRGNFSIKYPPTFYLDSTGRGVDYIFDSKNTMDLYFSGTNIPTLNSSQLVISFLSSVPSSHGNLQTLANLRQENLAPNAPYTKVTVNGIDGIKLSKTNGNPIEEYDFPTTSADISITAQSANSSLMPLFEQMIQTLKITQ